MRPPACLILALLVLVSEGGRGRGRGWGRRHAARRRARQPVHLPETRESKGEVGGGGGGGGDGGGGGGAPRAGSRRKARQLEVLELLEGAENGRYKVIAKAEPYKNLPPAPVTPEYEVTPPGDSQFLYDWGGRSHEPTPPPKEGLKFAPQREGKTQKYVPVRRTPVYNPSTPTYSVTPPAIAFEPTEPLKKSNKSPSTPSPGVFKISVENADLIPTPPPPPHISHLLETPPPDQSAAVKAKEEKLKERHEKARKEKERIEQERKEKELEKKERVEWREREARRKEEEERERKEKRQKEKAEKERQERERQDRERKERDRREKERKEREKKERERKEREKIERERKERERKERERKERERKEWEREERERREKEEIEAAEQQRAKNQELRSKAQTQKSESKVQRSKGATDGRKDKGSKGGGGGWETTHPDVVSNEIETTATSFKAADNYELVSTSIYDPRPRSRQYKKHKVLKGKGPGRGKGYKGGYRSSKKLPIRQSKSKDYSRSKSASSSVKFNPSERNFFSEIQGYKVKPHAFETVKRDGGGVSRRGGRGGQEVSLVRPRSPPPPEPIFLSSAAARPLSTPPRTPTPLLHTPVPSAAGPFTAFTTFSPAPTSPTPSHATAVARHRPPPVPSQPRSLPNDPRQPRFSSFAPSPPSNPPPSHPLPSHPPPPHPLPSHPLPSHPLPQPLTHPQAHPLPHPALLPAAPASLAITPDEMFEIFEARPYSFNFGVDDEYSGVDYTRAESRSDAGVTRGSYSVALPDGRVQTVSYTADDNGFHATVTYEGEPSYGGRVGRAQGTKEGRKGGKPSYRASNRVVQQGPKQTFSPHPPSPKPLRISKPVHRVARPPPPPPPPSPPQSPLPPPSSPLLPTNSPAFYSTTTIAPIVTKTHSLPHIFSPTPSPYPTPSSPYPSPSTPYPPPSPSPFYGSPTPQPYSYSPTPTPAPIFHTTPSYILGLKASGQSLPAAIIASSPRPHLLTQTYIPPTTWKPKYPRILEHTLRSAPSKRSYGHRLKKREDEEENEEEKREKKGEGRVWRTISSKQKPKGRE